MPLTALTTFRRTVYLMMVYLEQSCLRELPVSVVSSTSVLSRVLATSHKGQLRGLKFKYLST